jgi:MFS superfamily sulfate permease-like transporter
MTGKPKNKMFTKLTLRYDLKAGLVVFLVALPLCLGIALAQNAPLFSGIISGIIGGLVVASVSGSKLSVSGPAAGLTSIVLTSVATLGSFEAFLLSVFIAGLIQILLGILRAGIIGYYFPSAVIKGMLSAIGIILILKQIPHLLGDDKDPEGDEAFFQVDDANTFSEFLRLFDAPHIGSILIGVISIGILILWNQKFITRNKIMKTIPGPLIVVVVAVILDLIFSMISADLQIKPENLVRLPVFNNIGDLFDSLSHPDFSAWQNPKIYEVAAIIAAVASLETLLSLEAVDKLDPDNQISPTNRELVAQGIGNSISGLIGGLPITAVIVRSSANVSAGGKTQASSIFHGILFLIALFILPNVLQMIPLSALAAVLIMTGYKLARPGLFANMYKQGLDQFLPFVLTILVMLFSDLLKGVAVGIVVSVFFILKQNYKSPFKMISEEIDGKTSIFMKLSQNVTFINKGKFIEVFKSIPPGSEVHIDGGRCSFIDKDVLELISAYKQSAHIHRIKVKLEEVEEVKILSNH